MKVERIKVTRRNLPLDPPKIAMACRFPSGTSDVAVAVDFVANCGCHLEFGKRLDNAETAMLSTPCDTHREQWSFVLDRLLEDQETPTEELLRSSLESLDRLYS